MGSLDHSNCNGLVPTHTPAVKFDHAAVKLSSVPASKSGSSPFRLERETSSVRLLVGLCAALVTLDVVRQLCCYAMKYHNADTFPLPSTFLVFTGEALKLLIFSARMAHGRTLCSSPVSFAYVVPSTMYALNNNIYFLALHFTTPPVWNILMQSRIIFTALVYMVFFRKAITSLQWTGLVLLTVAIVILQFSGSDGILSSGAMTWNILAALGLAIIASVFAAVGPVYTEYLLKHDKRSFDDKQFQMYLFGSLLTGAFFLFEEVSSDSQTSRVSIQADNHVMMMSLICIYLFASVIGGIVVAVIIKKLDNIVKLYTQAVSCAVTAFASVVLFPRSFHFDGSFVVSFILTLVAIYLYEVKSLSCWAYKVPAETLQ